PPDRAAVRQALRRRRRRARADDDGERGRRGAAGARVRGGGVSTGVGAAVRRGPREVVVGAMSVFSAFGAGVEPLLAAVLSGKPGFAPVERFEVGARRAKVAAAAPGSPDLVRELVRTIDEACDFDRADTRLFLAVHGDPALARSPGGSTEAFASRLA